MIWAMRQLGAPLRYLRISQGSGLLHSKLTYDLVIPLCVSSGVTFVVMKTSAKLGVFTDSGLIPNVINLLNLLIAFFIAALAAVATFDRKGLDDNLKGEPAILRLRNSQDFVVEHALTHRQFVCYLFGYLSFASIMLLMTLYAVRMFGDDLQPVVNAGSAFPFLKATASFVFFFLMSQMMVTMLLGIYFLCDRLQFLDDRKI